MGENGTPSSKEVITELVLTNGMMLAVYGTREQIHARLATSGTFAEFECHSMLSSANKGVYSIRVDQVMMIGVERDPRKPVVTEGIDLTEFFNSRNDGAVN